jgi:hypothetical protein
MVSDSAIATIRSPEQAGVGLDPKDGHLTGIWMAELADVSVGVEQNSSFRAWLEPVEKCGARDVI